MKGVPFFSRCVGDYLVPGPVTHLVHTNVPNNSQDLGTRSGTNGNENTTHTGFSFSGPHRERPCPRC